MLRFLFPRLTAESVGGAALFEWATAQARASHWYVGGGVEDTIDGRFAMLATVTGLVSVRLEQAGESGTYTNVALTERFIEVMEAEHRELGLGDPALGRTVRKLVGSLGRRVELWRNAIAGGGDWNETVRRSLMGEGELPPESLTHVSDCLRTLWQKLQATSDSDITKGRIA
jgi:cytochrome b pre-mRNA-processing protein 3